jgi:iron complex outermembrane receptor protein
LTAGLRYTSVKQDSGQYRSVLLPTATSASPPNPATHICCDFVYDIVAGDPFFEGSVKSSQLTPRVSLQYQFTPDLMAYVTYSEGFNEGGLAFFGGQSKAYDPEVLTNYEAGIRSDLFDKRLRLNGTVFYGDWSKIQVREQFLDPVTGAPRVLTTNAGAAKVKGLEIEGAWQVTDPFRVNFAYGYLDTKYTDVGRATQISLNTRFSFAPKNSYNLGAAYTWSMAGNSSMVLSGDYSWRSDFTMDRATASQIDQEAYGLLGARLTYKPSGGKWDAALFGTNLTNEYFASAGFAIPPDGIRAIVLGRPREYGFTMNFRF